MPTPTQVLREVRRFIEAARPDVDADRALVERFARTRDERAFAELVRRHGPMVLGVCRRVLRHSADADDAFQTTFLILVRRAADIRDPERLGPWLYGVAWRTANKLRTSRRPGLPLPDELTASTPKPDWPVELDAAIARLPEKYRTPVVLCHLQGLSPSEVAGRLGCAPATVVTRLFRAREALRRRLTSLGVAVPPALVAGTVLDIPSSLASAVAELAAGRTTSPAAARLADGVFRSMLMTKVRWAVTAAVCLGGVTILGFHAGGQEPASATPPPRVTTKPPPSVPSIPPSSPAVPPPADPPPSIPAAMSYDRVEEVVAITTANFRVRAPSGRIARLIGDAAERARKDVAILWLGKELPAWPDRWPIDVTVSKGVSGATAFDFGKQPLRGEMTVEGELDRLLADTVPHEVTHCVMASHFKAPLPRWADEGISLLSESEEEQSRYDQIARQTLNAGSGVQLRALFASRDYPNKDMLGFFAQSHSVTKFLVGKKDRPTFIKFVAAGMNDGWESTARAKYGFESLELLEREWLNSLRAVRLQTPQVTAHRPTGNPALMIATTDEAGRIVVGLPVSYEPTTSYVQRRKTVEKNGKPIEQTSFEPVTTYRMVRDAGSRAYAVADVQAFTADGQRIDSAKLIETLRAKPTPVVVASDWDGSQKTYAQILKPEAIVLVVPPPRPLPVARGQ